MERGGYTVETNICCCLQEKFPGCSMFIFQVNFIEASHIDVSDATPNQRHGPQIMTNTRKNGKVVLQRKRKQRSDVGTKRPAYKRKRIHAALRAQPTARFLSRDKGEVLEMAEAPDGVSMEHTWHFRTFGRKEERKGRPVGL